MRGATLLRKVALVLMGVGVISTLIRADDDVLPGSGFGPERYESLTAHSPFAVATPEESPTSAEYALIGVAHIAGIDYASLINKQTKDRILIWSRKDRSDLGPVSSLTLISIQAGNASGGASAVVKYDGKSVVLRLHPASLAGNIIPLIAPNNSPVQDGHFVRPLMIPPLAANE